MDNLLVTKFLTEQISFQHSIWLFLLVFLGGVISSISPCTLGLLPVIVGYVGGYSKDTKDKRILVQIFFFIFGLAFVMTFFGLMAAFTGKVLGFQASPVWALILSSLILIMGLSLLEIVEIPIPTILKKLPKNNNNSLILYPLMLGGAFSFATSPCSTPILAGIMTYISLKANLVLGGLLLFFFSLGQGVILVIAGVFASLFKKMMFLRTISGYFVKFSGVILILSAVYIYLKTFGIIF